MPILREYSHIARLRHFCDCCHRDIYPGEEYTATVMVCGRGRLVVIKYHSNPPCEPEPDPADEYEESDSYSCVFPASMNTQAARAA